MSTRRPHLHSAGATRVRAAVVLPVLLLLLVACVVACPLCVRAVDTSSYEEAERTNTLAFLQSFVTPGSTLTDVWTGTDFCTWTYVTCAVRSVTLDLQALRPTAPLALPELADGVDGGSVLLGDIVADGLGSSLSGTLPASWGRLTKLRFVSLEGNALTGSLPADWCSLTGLLVLSVSDNAFTGTLPAEWGSLRRLSFLDVSVNQLTGPIPEPWSSMSSLRYLYLQSNQLTGAIPAGLGARHLFEVNISSNQFCGCVSSLWKSSSTITLTADPAMRAVDCMSANACAVDESSSPAERATLAFLQNFAVSMPSLQSVWADTRYCAWPGVACTMDKDVTLEFADVALTTAGSLPALSDSVDGSLIPLTQVRISGKGAMVSGQLPASWSRLTGLTEVTLAGNALTGPLPVAWSSLTGLQTLNLGNNALSGALPAEWSSLRGLQTLNLGGNALSGSVPAEWRTCVWLNALNLSNNALTGPLPADWSSLTDLETLSLGNNHLTGPLPAEWSSLRALLTVDLGNNALTGPVPAEWRTFRWLSALNMSRNAFSGTLPADWSSLWFLASLDLSMNKVHGTLPVSWSNMIALGQLHLNNNELTGTIPSRMGFFSLSTVDISSNQFTGCAPRQWRESCSLTLRADPPMTTGVCAIDKSCDGKSGSAASFNSGECEVTGCARCEVGAARVCARCEPGYILTGAKSCAKEGSGVAADARAGAVVAAVTCAVLAFSLVMTL